LPRHRRAHSIVSVLRAGLGSIGLHLFVLAAGGGLWSAWPVHTPTPQKLLADRAAAGLLDSEALIDLGAIDSALPDEVPWPPRSPTIANLPEADEANQDSQPAAGARGAAGEQATPAPDQGDGTGRKLPDASRRDASTLRARLTTGAHLYQPSRERNATRASSPQEVRRERRAGVGDSARTASRRLTEAVPVVPPAPEEMARNEDPQPHLDEQRRTPLEPGDGTTRGEGPLDADVGGRAFDVPVEGPARDTVAARQASDELNPGLTDYAMVAARGDGDQGRGPAQSPGISRSSGSAASFAGWPSPRPATEDAGEGTSERLYAREHLEIRRRVARRQRFPHRLAVMLEQGEAIVQFQVERDGRLAGAVKLLKSAGFEEFDQEALAAVQRAAPFPQMARPLLVRMRIGFQNPLVR
jgi:TonB family protein